MEREGLVRDFGDSVIFHDSIDNQQTLAFGSVDDVVNEVRESVEIYGGARWILRTLLFHYSFLRLEGDRDDPI